MCRWFAFAKERDMFAEKREAGLTSLAPFAAGIAETTKAIRYDGVNHVCCTNHWQQKKMREWRRL
jgi:hypothetical protein